jgi:hypothetical protein
MKTQLTGRALAASAVVVAAALMAAAPAQATFPGKNGKIAFSFPGRCRFGRLRDPHDHPRRGAPGFAY